MTAAIESVVCDDEHCEAAAKWIVRWDATPCGHSEPEVLLACGEHKRGIAAGLDEHVLCHCCDRPTWLVELLHSIVPIGGGHR